MRARASRLCCALLCVCTLPGVSDAQLEAPLLSRAAPPASAFAVDVTDPSRAPRFIVYGDMRFTDAGEQEASRPGPRQALVAQIAAEQPDALFLTGDVPWHGGNEADYRVYREETAKWRALQLHVFPALGNHEFQQCAEPVCLEHWWQTFPPLRGRRWYAATLGRELQFFILDSNASLLAGSAQAAWLQHEIDALGDPVRFVLVLLHHPPLTDGSQGVRDNEAALARQLTVAALHRAARFVVCAGHVHNYERFERAGVTYLVSGGGGAKPVPVTRSAADRYRSDLFPNFHYLRFELSSRELRGEMIRLTNPDERTPGAWAVGDRFEVKAAPP